MCVNLSNGQRKSISFAGEFEYRAAEEREYIFEHTWKQVDEKFYDKNIHGLDWKAMHDNYVQFLPYITNGEDFKDLLSEMLGELNGSHTGARYYSSGNRNVGMLGVLFDEKWQGEGLRIAEVLPGSRLQIVYPELKAGDVIKYQAAEDVVENGMLLFTKGAGGEGVVTKVTQAKNFGRNAEIEIDFKTLTAVDGREINMTLGEESKKSMEQVGLAAGASLAGMAILGPVGIITGVFVNGKNIDLPEGTELYIQTKADETIYAIPTTE